MVKLSMHETQYAFTDLSDPSWGGHERRWGLGDRYDKFHATFNGGVIAGECYEPEGISKLKQEDATKILKRIDFTLENEHQTPYEHTNVTVEISAPKIIMMVLNAEQQCSTSEKSARYTRFEAKNGVSPKEAELYNKWLELFKSRISAVYGFNNHVKPKITKLAQENARYLTSVFTQTQAIYTTNWIQWNRIARYSQDFIDQYQNGDDALRARIADELEQLISELRRLNVLDDRAMTNYKQRCLRLFDHWPQSPDYFGYVYSTVYLGYFAQLAQAHRHRTIDYTMGLTSDTQFYVPPILETEKSLKQQWIEDMRSVADNYPQGMLVEIHECGTFKNFLLKCKERLCSAAQLETMEQTARTLHKFDDRFSVPYLKGARCTFPDYTCHNPCQFSDGINLRRKI
jgi:hypothetical protein